jgi:hypothetical protein
VPSSNERPEVDSFRAGRVVAGLYEAVRRCYASIMSVELYVSLTSLAGVLLGGTMSYAVQRSTQHSADRAEARRQNITLAEARYAERVDVIGRFLDCAQDAERVAFDRHVGGADGADWHRRAYAGMDHLYVAEKMIRILCSDLLHEAAHAFTNTLREAIGHELDDFDVGSHLSADRANFLSAARLELEQLHAGASQ